MRRHHSTKPLRRQSAVFAQAIGVIALTVPVFAGACSHAKADDARFTHAPANPHDKAESDRERLPPGALARLGTLRWRHGDVITYVAFLPDGKTVLTAALDNTMRLWDRESGKELRRFAIAQASAPQPVLAPRGGGLYFAGRLRGQRGIALLEDGRTLAALMPNNVIQLWDSNSGKELRQLKAPPAGASLILFSPDGNFLAVRARDGQIYLLDPDMARQTRPLRARQPDGPNLLSGAGMAFAPDNSTMAMAERVSDNGQLVTQVKLISVDFRVVVRKIETTPQPVPTIAFAPNGKFLAFVGGNTAHRCAADTSKADTRNDHRHVNIPGGARTVVFSPDSKVFAVKGHDQVIRLFATDSVKEVGQLGEAIHAPGVNQEFLRAAADSRDIAFSPDGKLLAAAENQLLRFWNVSSAKPLNVAGGHRGSVTALALTPDGNSLVSRGAENVIRRWDLSTGKDLGQFQAPPGTTDAAFSPDARTIALGNTDATIRVVDVGSGKQIHQFKGHVKGAAALAFSPDGKMLASRGSSDDTIRLFGNVNGAELRQNALPANNPAGAERVITLPRRYAGATGLALAFSPDGQTLAASGVAQYPQKKRDAGPVENAGAGNMLRMWDVTTGEQIHQISLPQSISAVNIAFSPDGRVLALENVNQVIHMVEITSGKERGQLGMPVKVAPADQFSSSVEFEGGFAQRGINQLTASTTLAFAPDGETLAAKGPNQSVRLWDMATFKEIGRFQGHEGAISSIAFAHDGKTLATGSNDTTILVWDLTRIKREPKRRMIELPPTEIESLWTDLYGDDAAKAYRSILTLASASRQTVAFLRQQLQPVALVDAKKIDRLIVDLDSNSFKTRILAAAELEKLGELVVPALKKVLAAPASVEIRRRVEPMLAKLSGGLTAEQVRLARGVEVLERLNTAEARQVLETLSKGAPGAFPTHQGQAALGRLARRSIASTPR